MANHEREAAIVTQLTLAKCAPGQMRFKSKRIRGGKFAVVICTQSGCPFT
jgi:hypothetical protein